MEWDSLQNEGRRWCGGNSPKHLHGMIVLLRYCYWYSNMMPIQAHGYPDDGYLQRVTEELAGKGISVNSVLGIANDL